MSHVFETTCQCPSCRGTGLYQGFAEGPGVAVVCHRCKGTGEGSIRVEWTPFRGRLRREGVERVVRVNVDGAMDDPRCGGMAYQDWLDGKPFPPGSENRLGSCPAWWCQATGLPQPSWPECVMAGESFYRCGEYPNRERCWERFDKDRR
jgi:hypothetical protein